MLSTNISLFIFFIKRNKKQIIYYNFTYANNNNYDILPYTF